MKRRRAWGLAQLLLLAAALPCLKASRFDSYMVHPKSYLDVLRSTSADQTLSAHVASAACDPSAPTGSCQHSPSHSQLLAAQQPPAVLNSGFSNSWNMGPTSAGAPSEPSRSVQHRAANPLRLQPPYDVCVSSWDPMVRCTDGAEQSEFQGYQIELFRMAAEEVGWAEADYFFTCMDYSTMMADLNDPAGNCSLSAAGVEVLPATLAAGLKFSWPTYKSGLRVMIHTHLTSGSTWAFSEIFRWEVWLLLAATAIGVGILVGILEVANRTEPVTESRGKQPNWQSWEWYSLAKVVHVIPHVGDPRADASRVLVLGYGFLVLVMVSMYTAVAASRITAAALVHPVRSVRNLAGRGNPLTTLAWDQYVQPLESHQDIHAIGMQWEREGDLLEMVTALKDGKYSALILDAPVLEHAVGTSEECDLFLVGDMFETFSIALAFPPAFDDAVIYAFSQSIVKLQTYQGALDMLENVYIKTGGTDKCFGSNAGGHGSGEMIELRQVSGLWYILQMTVGVCLVLTLQHNIRKDPRKMATVRRLSGIGGSFVKQTMRWLSSAGHGAQAEGGAPDAATAVEPIFLPNGKENGKGLDHGAGHQQGNHGDSASAASLRGAQQHVAPRNIDPFFSPRVLAAASQNGGAAKSSSGGGVGGQSSGGGRGSSVAGQRGDGGGGGHSAAGGGAGSQLGSKLSAAGGGSNAGSNAGGLNGSGGWQGLLSRAGASSSSGSGARQQQQPGPRGPSALQVFLGTDYVESDEESESPISPIRARHLQEGGIPGAH